MPRKPRGHKVHQNEALTRALFHTAGIPDPEPEYRFAAKEVGEGEGIKERLRGEGLKDWKFDWAWPNWRVALEIEGGVFGRGAACALCGQRRGGAHSSISGMLRDIEKYNAAQLLGWLILRVTPAQFNSGEASELVRRAIALRSGVDNQHEPGAPDGELHSLY